ncbi:hypothetical protein KY328_03085 [Candidatus Woesearchaeota archaeon]|nr:hypothetical protein [Candidatus Woesearchaeota archaeon]MBW3021877.1 hypothetical protein [Candidatus Woesearchaeota archaeon]
MVDELSRTERIIEFLRQKYNWSREQAAAFYNWSKEQAAAFANSTYNHTINPESEIVQNRNQWIHEHIDPTLNRAADWATPKISATIDALASTPTHVRNLPSYTWDTVKRNWERMGNALRVEPTPKEGLDSSIEKAIKYLETARVNLPNADGSVGDKRFNPDAFSDIVLEFFDQDKLDKLDSLEKKRSLKEGVKYANKLKMYGEGQDEDFKVPDSLTRKLRTYYRTELGKGRAFNAETTAASLLLTGDYEKQVRQLRYKAKQILDHAKSEPLLKARDKVREYKWLESEKEGKDIGIKRAWKEWLENNDLEYSKTALEKAANYFVQAIELTEPTLEGLKKDAEFWKLRGKLLEDYIDLVVMRAGQEKDDNDKFEVLNEGAKYIKNELDIYRISSIPEDYKGLVEGLREELLDEELPIALAKFKKEALDGDFEESLGFMVKDLAKRYSGEKLEGDDAAKLDRMGVDLNQVSKTLIEIGEEKPELRDQVLPIALGFSARSQYSDADIAKKVSSAYLEQSKKGIESKDFDKVKDSLVNAALAYLNHDPQSKDDAAKLFKEAKEKGMDTAELEKDLLDTIRKAQEEGDYTKFNKGLGIAYALGTDKDELVDLAYKAVENNEDTGSAWETFNRLAVLDMDNGQKRKEDIKGLSDKFYKGEAAQIAAMEEELEDADTDTAIKKYEEALKECKFPKSEHGARLMQGYASLNTQKGYELLSEGFADYESGIKNLEDAQIAFFKAANLGNEDAVVGLDLVEMRNEVRRDYEEIYKQDTARFEQWRANAEKRSQENATKYWKPGEYEKFQKELNDGTIKFRSEIDDWMESPWKFVCDLCDAL